MLVHLSAEVEMGLSLCMDQESKSGPARLRRERMHHCAGSEFVNENSAVCT